MVEICRHCESDVGQRVHHALIMRNDVQLKMLKRVPELARHIEQPINKPPICNECHVGGGHISRDDSHKMVLRDYSQNEINTFFQKANDIAIENGVTLPVFKHQTN